MQRGMADTDRDLRQAENAAGGLNYASLSPDIKQARAKMDDTTKKLKEFEQAYDAYVSELEQFDHKSAQLLHNMPEIKAWVEHSGWTADPAIVTLNLMEKLVQDGVVKNMAAARAFLLEIKESLAGAIKTCAFSTDPVNMSTGNFIYSMEDIRIPGAFPLVFKRFYNSVGGSGDVMGQNWTHSFNILLQEKGGRAKIIFEDGHAEYYEQNEDGSYQAPSEKSGILIKTEKEFILNVTANLSYRFDPAGRLMWKSDLNGNKTAFTYKQGLLAEISNRSGKLAFAYTEDGFLSEVSDHTGRQVSFVYNDKRLAEVKQPSGAIYQYVYNNNGNLVKIINPAGITFISNIFDEHGRTIRQRFADGGCQSFLYEDEALSTTATEQNGNQVKYVRDTNYRTIKIEFAGSEERFEYNDNDQLIMHQDRNGNVRRYEYDNHGNLIRKTDPLGNTTKMEYDSFNRLLSILHPDNGQVFFSYDQQGNMLQTADPVRRIMAFAYNDCGQTQRLTMPDGSQNELTYDERGNITAIIDANGATVSYEYNELNQVIKTVNGEGHATRFAYNAKGDIARAINAEDKERVYEYNAVGSLSKIIDYNGGETLYQYNNLNKIEEINDPLGNVTKFRYDLMWNIAAITDPCNNETRYVYDKLNRLSATIDAEGHITRYEHDANGNVTALISPDQARTEFIYDVLDRVTEVREADQTVTKYEYDQAGNLVKLTDQQGRITEQEYDQAGQLLKRISPLGHITRFTYTPLGQLESVTDATGGVLRYQYYPGGRLKKVTLPEGENETYQYDKNGNIVRVVNALQQATELVYDSLDRVIEIKNPLGHYKRFAYDAAGNILKVMDENGHATQYRYSLLGDIIEVIDPLGHSTKYGYDQTQRLSKVEQYRLIDDALAGIKEAEAQITTYERNKNGAVTAVNAPLGKVMRFKYDCLGNVISKLDEDGLETLYEYNLANKLIKIAYADGRTVEFAYNPLKQLTQMKDWLGATTVTSDVLGRAKQITDFEGKTIHYEWDELHRKTKVIYPDSSEVKYTYNHSGRLSGVISTVGETHYRYDAQGRISERLLPNGLTTCYEFDPAGRLKSLIHTAGGEILDHYKYTYDPVGNITRINKQRQGLAIDSGLFEYTYDPLGRLATAAHGENKKQYFYDNLGNRIAVLEPSCAVHHEYNALNQLIRTHDGDISVDYHYDKRGNLREVLENSNLKASYIFDATNMLTQVCSTGKGRAEYIYDGLRNRVKQLQQFNDLETPLEAVLPKTGPSQEIRYVLDTTLPYNNLLMTEDGQTRRYIWGHELLGAAGANLICYLQDHLGSPIRLIDDRDDSDQNTPLAYDEFGVPLVKHANTGNPFGYAGYLADDISGLYYAQARYYDPQSNRWLAQDTHWNDKNRLYGDNKDNSRLHGKKRDNRRLNWNKRVSSRPSLRAITQSANLYTYCHNNPLAFLDPLGQADVLVKDAYVSQGINTENIIWDQAQGVGRGEITINLPGVTQPLILEEGMHFYINKTDDRAYFINNPDNMIPDIQNIPENIIDQEQVLQKVRNLSEGVDYYIGNDGKAYLYGNVITHNEILEGLSLEECPDATSICDRDVLLFIDKRYTKGNLHASLKGVGHFIGADGKPYFAFPGYGPPAPIKPNIKDIWDEHTKERIQTLHPEIRDKVTQLILDLQKQDMTVRVTDYFRTMKEQDELFDKKITKAKGGQSYHNYGLAIDVVEIKDGNANYDSIESYEKIAAAAKAIGFEWGGDWTTPDKPHFQIAFGYKCSELLDEIKRGNVDENGYINFKGIVKKSQSPNQLTDQQSQNITAVKAVLEDDQLRKMGMYGVTDEMAVDLNRVLNKYNITKSEEIEMFIATCTHESKTGLFEQGVGNKYVKNGVDYRGGGYIQLTGMANYQAFADQMLMEGLVTLDKDGNNPIMTGGAQYVADNFAWESAGWFWNAPGNNCNKRIAEGETFYQISQVVNGGPKYTGEPKGWDDRKVLYELAKKVTIT
jgi:RHS repeat-associated protein